MIKHNSYLENKHVQVVVWLLLDNMIQMDSYKDKLVKYSMIKIEQKDLVVLETT